jgi:hypothetical protein
MRARSATALLHHVVMSIRAQLRYMMATVAVLGVGLAIVAAPVGESVGAVLIALSVVAVLLAGLGAVSTVRWLGPTTRLPEHLRNSGPGDWRRSR